METMVRDPIHIAEVLKVRRNEKGWTQENLAEAAGVSERTIQKAESGRHPPAAQTLKSIARALDCEVKVFEKPTPEEEAHLRRAMERAIRKTALVRTRPVRTARDFLDQYGEWHRWRIDTSAVPSEEALEIVAGMGDWLSDLDGFWGMLPMSERLVYARSFAELCQRLEEHGLLCFMGHHRQRLKEKGKPDLVFVVGMMSIQPGEDTADSERCILVELDGAWETLDEDRVD